MEVDEKQMYRVYRDERIYFNKYVWSLFNESGDVYKWRDLEVTKAEVGDWVIADDDNVLRIMNKRCYKNVIFYKFCNVQTNYSSYLKKNGEISHSYSKFLGGYTGLKNTRGLNAKYEDRSIKKVAFANLLVAGMHPYKAFSVAINNERKKVLTIDQLNFKIIMLLKDPIVREIINSGVKKMGSYEIFENKVEQQFSDECLIKELKELIEKSRKGTDAHRENIKFVLALTNKLPTRLYGKKMTSIGDKNLEIEETNYEIEQPPALSQNT